VSIKKQSYFNKFFYSIHLSSLNTELYFSKISRLTHFVIILCFSALVAIRQLTEKNDKLSQKGTKSLMAMPKIKFIKYQSVS